MTTPNTPLELTPDYWDALVEMAAEAQLSPQAMLRVLVREGQALRRPAKLRSMRMLEASPEREAKQVIVLRKDLNMRKGKMVAQGAHASWAALLPNARFNEQEHTLTLKLDEPAWAWLATGRFKKICVSVPDEKALFDVHRQAKLQGLPCELILDAGLTEFGQPTYTGLAVGPAWPEEVDAVTGQLPLL